MQDDIDQDQDQGEYQDPGTADIGPEDISQSGPYRWSAHSTPKLDAAMAAAQGEIQNAIENRKNPHLNSSYADLGSIFNAIREPCSRHGIARYQTPWTHNRGLIVTTRIAHDGEWVEADFRVNVEEMKGIKRVQMAGSAITYVKRYAISAMFGCAPGDDDDGESSESAAPRVNPNPNQAKWRAAVDGFGALGVKPGQMLAWLKRRNSNDVDEPDHRRLQDLYNRVKSGATSMESEMSSESTGG